MRDASKGAYGRFITGNVEKGSTLISDDWAGLSGIESRGYRRVIHRQPTVTGRDEKLPHVHLVVSLLKRWLLGTHQGAVDSKHLLKSEAMSFVPLCDKHEGKLGIQNVTIIHNFVGIIQDTVKKR